MCLSAQSHKLQGWIRSSRRNALTLVSLALFASAAVHAAPAVNAIKPGIFGDQGDTAILGYDTVAYFTDGKPVKGQDKLVAEYMGAKWLFASKAHLDAFKADPASTRRSTAATAPTACRRTIWSALSLTSSKCLMASFI